MKSPIHRSPSARLAVTWSRRSLTAASALAASAPTLALAQQAAGEPAPSSGGAPLVIFWIIAVGTVAGAIATVTARNTIAAVMSLVGTFFGVAALYAMLSAHFLAAIQVLVYAGAIMTLFVFVVMVLNREEVERWSVRGVVTKTLGVVAATYLVVRTSIYFLADVQVVSKADAPPAGWGGIADVGMKLFTDHLFAFEAVSLPLLIAVIGAVVVARTPKRTLREHEGGLSHSPVDAEGNPIHPPAADDHDDHAGHAPAGNAHGAHDAHH